MRISDWSSDVFSSDLGHLAAVRDVAALCDGDPFFYGSFMYLFGRVAERFPVEVVPGVSSLTACAAVLGAPLAARNDVLTIIPATLEQHVLAQQLRDAEAAAVIRSEEHTSELQSLMRISYAVFCLKKNKHTHRT